MIYPSSDKKSNDFINVRLKMSANGHLFLYIVSNSRYIEVGGMCLTYFGFSGLHINSL